jgi:hypothetical protein
MVWRFVNGPVTSGLPAARELGSEPSRQGTLGQATVSQCTQSASGAKAETKPGSLYRAGAVLSAVEPHYLPCEGNGAGRRSRRIRTGVPTYLLCVWDRHLRGSRLGRESGPKATDANRRLLQSPRTPH